MKMKKYQIAGLVINMNIYGNLLASQAEKYLCLDRKEPQFTIDLPLSFYKERQENNPHLSLEEVEYLYAGSLFYNKLLDFNGFLLHSSAIRYKNQALIFSASSGTGKSTHTQLWKSVYNDEIEIINDDKPAIRKIDNTFYCCGTPFSGKNDISCNLQVPCKALIFIKRAPTNSIRKMENLEAFKCILEQTVRIMKKERMSILMDLLNDFINEIPIYELSCNISTQAVTLVHDTFFK